LINLAETFGLRIGALAASVTLIAGCTMGWVRSGSSAEQTRNDNAECQLSAAGKYPPNIIRAHSLDSGEPKLDEDANSLLRDEEGKFCMRQKGYVFERVQ
jgi:hypothetical protein